MWKSRHARGIVAVGLLVLFVCATGLRAESSADDELLKIVPAESLFCMRVNNFEYTVRMIDQFLAGGSSMPMAVSVLVRTQFAKVLGSPELNGVNMNGSFMVFGVILPDESTQTNPVSNFFLGGLVPVTDYRQFISHNPNCGQPDEKGISKITSNGTTAMLVTQVGNYALISSANDYDKLAAMAKMISTAKIVGLANALDSNETKLATKEPLWMYGNVQQASRTFAPLVFGQLEQMKTVMEKAKSSGQKLAIDPAAMISMYADILETLMKETKSLSLTVRPKANVCNLTVSVTAVPGTDMANMFVADATAKQDNRLLAYLKDGAMMNFGCKIDTAFWKKLNIKSIDMLAVIAGESMTTEDIAKTKALVADAFDCLGGPIACSFSVDAKSKPPFAIKYVIAVKDEKKFDRLIEEAAEMISTSGIADFYKSMGMEMSFTIMQDVDRYKGVSIDSAKLAMKSTDANSPQGQMINAMYGEGFDYRWGMVDGLCVLAIGGDVDSAIRELIDEVKAGSLKQMAAEMKAALALLPEAGKADFIATYNFLRWVKMLGALAPVPMPMAQMDIPTKSNIVFAGNAGNGKMVVDIALPKEHLNEMMAAFQIMMQQKQQRKPKSPRSSGIESIPETDMTWVKCANKNCGAGYQMGKRAYFKYIQEHIEPMAMVAPPLVCKKCGKKSIYRAEKCGNLDCGIVFLRGSVPNDFADRCPACGNSNTEEQRKRHRAGGLHR
jgi:hypothetical protein